jgi:CheY-like chemotaxis protein
MEKTILIIDDSATIRRLANGTLSNAGFRVVLAENAQIGLRLAKDEMPSLILLDHQLPGTTGFEVCQQLLADDQTRSIPVIVSSTLRKQAYVEYADCVNVIDMLPKPYTEELLISTVAQAIETGRMVVSSQQNGTAVPEVINQVNGSDLCGSFEIFSLREVLDFINNGSKSGMLEVESHKWRVWFYLDKGRVQAVTANGIDPNIVTDCLPETLRSLAPVLRLSISGRSESQIDGLVQLLNNNVLDPRLLRKLLRHQAAILTFLCFRKPLKEFRFEPNREAPPLFRDLPLDISVLALLIEATGRCDESELPPNEPTTVFVRRAIRGQNLDRAGLSAQHQKIVGALSQPYSATRLAELLGWDVRETERVLFGLKLADIVEAQSKSGTPTAILFEPDPAQAQRMRDEAVKMANRFDVKVVRDRLSLKLLLRRESPDALILTIESPNDVSLGTEIRRDRRAQGGDIKIIHIVGENQEGLPQAESFRDASDGRITHPYDMAQLIHILDEVLANGTIHPANKGNTGGGPLVRECIAG